MFKERVSENTTAVIFVSHFCPDKCFNSADKHWFNAQLNVQ